MERYLRLSELRIELLLAMLLLDGCVVDDSLLIVRWNLNRHTNNSFSVERAVISLDWSCRDVHERTLLSFLPLDRASAFATAHT